MVWTVYLGVLVGYKYPEPALIPPTLPSACPLHHPLPCSSCSCSPSHPRRPTNPQSPVLVVLVRCPGGPGGNKRSCGGRDGRDGRPEAGYGGGAVGRSGSVRGATDRSRNRNKGTQGTVTHLSHTLGDRPHPEHFPRTIHPLPYVPNRCPDAPVIEAGLVADSTSPRGRQAWTQWPSFRANFSSSLRC